jgi:hypothetical protein
MRQMSKRIGFQYVAIFRNIVLFMGISGGIYTKKLHISNNIRIFIEIK